MQLRIALAYLLFVAANFAWASPPPLDLIKHAQNEHIASQLSYLEDPSTTLNIEDIFLDMGATMPWRPAGDDIPNFGFSNSAYWFRFQVLNPDEVSHKRLLQIKYALLDSVDAYIYQGDYQIEHFRAGHSLPFTERPFAHRSLVFPIEFPAYGAVDIYLRIKGSHGIQVPMLLLEEKTFWQQDQKYLAWQFLYYGLMLSMVLYNLIVAWGVRERTYLYYVATVAAVALFQMVLHGAAYQFLWPQATAWNTVSMAFLIPVSNAFSNIFCNKMLHLDLYYPKLYWPLKIQIILAPFLAVGSLLLPQELVIPVSTFFVVLTAGIVGVVCLLRWKEGELDARIFAIAWNAFVFGCVIMALNKFSLLPYNWLTENLMQIGSAVETILLSFALIVRINRLREERSHLERLSSEAKDRELQSLRELTEAKYESKAKSDFLAVMSHEIRTPMNGVLGVAELLKETTLNEKQSKLVNTIQSSGKLLLNLINDILDLSKIENGKLQLEKIEFNMHHTVNDALMMYHANKPKTDVLMLSFVDPEVAPNLLGDPTRIKQVVFNLLGNALKFTDKGHVFIWVKKANGNEKQQTIRVEVSDSGIGMTEEQIQFLFKPFSQADSSTTRKYGGTGLGLSISKNLIESMGGTIDVDSSPSQGSTFWFEIPLEIAGSSERKYKMESSSEILVCSDYLPFIQLITKALSRKTYKIQTISPTGLIPHLKQHSKPYDQSLIYLSNFRQEDLNTFDLASKKVNSLESDFWKKLGDTVLLTTNVSPINTMDKLQALSGPFNLNKILGFKQSALRNTEQITNEQLSLPELRVLVAEDNAVNQMVIVEMLKPIVGKVDVAENGVEAVEAVRSAPQPYHYVFMDCEMPLMDGYEATQQIRQWESSTSHSLRIVALTAHAFDEFKEKALASGMDAHLTKPLTRPTLLRFFREELGDDPQHHMSQVN